MSSPPGFLRVLRELATCSTPSPPSSLQKSTTRRSLMETNSVSLRMLSPLHVPRAASPCGASLMLSLCRSRGYLPTHQAVSHHRGPPQVCRLTNSPREELCWCRLQHLSSLRLGSDQAWEVHPSQNFSAPSPPQSSHSWCKDI